MTPAPIIATLAAILGLASLPPTALALEAGDKAAVCVGCHGPRGHSAVPDNPTLAAQHADYLSTSLKAYISGERDYGIMKTMAERLTPRDMADISAYFAAQPPFRSQARATGDVARGESKTTACVACHGPNGLSLSPMFPNLAGQHATYLTVALKAYRSGKRSNSLMLPMARTLSDQDIEDIAAYYAAQAPWLQENAK